MRSWTTPAAIGGLLLMLAGTTTLTARSAAVVRETLPSPPDTPVRQLRLIVGDTFRVALHGSPARLTLSVPGGPAPSLAATFRSSDSASVTVMGDNLLRALQPDTVTITAMVRGTMRPLAEMKVTVMTRRQAVNAMVMEVCPNEDEREFLQDAPVSEKVPVIHEFHDCQKLIAGSDYTSLVGIFAHSNVGTFQRWQDFAGGRVAATIVNFPNQRSAVSYPSLGIGPGINCLVLRARGPERWEAAVIPQSPALVTAGDGRNYAQCADSLTWASVGSRATRLRVVTQTGIDMSGRRIAPPVARWDWDADNRRNYIGVMCGAGHWCEIGPTGFSRSAAIMHSPTPNSAPMPLIKGYYDEQYLADSTAERPTSVFGTIRPGDNPRSVAPMSHARPQWHHVAQLRFRETARQMSNDYARYGRNYLGNQPGTFPDSFLATSNYHLMPTALPSDDPRGVYVGQFNGKPLPDTGVVYRWHSPHAGHMKVATTRWRWVGNDEKTWTFCSPDGCCENVDVLIQ